MMVTLLEKITNFKSINIEATLFYKSIYYVKPVHVNKI